MRKKSKYLCPLCGSLLGKSRYLQIVGVWEERAKLERSLKNEISGLKKEREKAQKEKKVLERKIKKETKEKVKSAYEKGKKMEKKRADRLANSIRGKTQRIQQLNRKVKELQEQLEKGTTPQVEGLNLEQTVLKQLRKAFPQDKIVHHGKAGDIMQHVCYGKREVGSLLYECKKTGRFSNAFVEQTRKALAKRHASYGILVTIAFKRKTAGFWVEKDILVVHPFGAVYVAQVLRNSLIEMHSLRISSEEIRKRSQQLMTYIRSDDFKNCVRDSIYRTKNLYEMLKKEMKNHRGVWEKRYKNYVAIYDNTNRMEIVTSNILKGLPVSKAKKQIEIKQLPLPVG